MRCKYRKSIVVLKLNKLCCDNIVYIQRDVVD
jgi:hypothetical protein